MSRLGQLGIQMALTEPSPLKIFRSDRVGPKGGERGVIKGESSSVICDVCELFLRDPEGRDTGLSSCDCAVVASAR